MKFLPIFLTQILFTKSFVIPNFRSTKILGRYVRIKTHNFSNCVVDNINTKNMKKTGKLLILNKERYLNNTSLVIMEKGKSVSTYDFTLELIKEAEKNDIIDKNNRDIIFFILLSLFEMEVYNNKKKIGCFMYL
tara:strand:+ start:1397 stop:1798 length:402 start_codon:yes stop_codon:yes gene_type:complete